MGHLGEGAKPARAALPLLRNALFIYSSVEPCFSWEITSWRVGGSWQDVGKEIALPPPRFKLLGSRGVAAGDALGEEEAESPQVGLGTSQPSLELRLPPLPTPTPPF